MHNYPAEKEEIAHASSSREKRLGEEYSRFTNIYIRSF